MARIRSLKPEFFTDEDLAKLPPLFRIGFQGLWCHADKAGRLEDRPARLKVQILPYDDVSFGVVLDALVAARFVQRYSGPDGKAYLQIRSFEKHQRPRPDEPESELPSPSGVTETDTLSALLRDADVSAECIGKEGKGKEREEERGGSTPKGFRPPDVVDLWNATVTPPIPKVTQLTADRTSKINARLKTYPDQQTWQTVFQWVNTQDWMRAPGTGQHPNWTVTLDWLCKNDGQLQRCLERAQAAPAPRRGSTCPHEPECESITACTALSLSDARKARAS